MGEPSIIGNSTPRVAGKRSRGDVPATKVAADMAAVQSHSQRWSPDLKPQSKASQLSVVEGVDGAILAWFAHECNRIWGQELTLEKEETHADLEHRGKL